MIGDTLEDALNKHSDKRVKIIYVGDDKNFDTMVVVRETEKEDILEIVCNKLTMKVNGNEK